MILPWFREFVHVPVRQHNNSAAGNQINKSRSQTHIPRHRHTPKSFHSFIFSHEIFLIIPTSVEFLLHFICLFFITFKAASDRLLCVCVYNQSYTCEILKRQFVLETNPFVSQHWQNFYHCIY